MLISSVDESKDQSSLVLNSSNVQEQGQVDSLIPLLFYDCRNAQTAADVGIAFYETAVGNFEKASHSLLRTVAGDDALSQRVSRFIEGCKYACTANLNWR